MPKNVKAKRPGGKAAAKKAATKEAPAKKAKTAKPKAESAPERRYRIGDELIFTGRDDGPAAFEPGDRLRVSATYLDGRIKVFLLDERGKFVEPNVSDIVHSSEVEPPSKKVEPFSTEAAVRRRTRASEPEADQDDTVVSLSEETRERMRQQRLAGMQRSHRRAVNARLADTVRAAGAEATGPAEAESEQDSTRVESSLPWEHDPEVKKLLGANRFDAMVKDLAAKKAAGDFILAGTLAEMRENKDTLPAEYRDQEGFQRFCQEQLGFEKSKGYSMAGTYIKFRQAGWGSADFGRFGWTKARSLARLPVKVLTDSRDALVDLAQNSSTRELDERITENWINVGGERVKKVTFTFKLHADEAHMAQQALEHAMGQVQEANQEATPSRAFAYIVGEYMSAIDGADFMAPEQPEQGDGQDDEEDRQAAYDAIAAEADRQRREEDDHLPHPLA